jgi:nitronate monooxygenase
MGVGVSSWRLARAVSLAGQLGVVSGTALAAVAARRLQLGDPEGHMRRAMAAFPWPEMAQRVHDAWFTPDGVAPSQPFRGLPMLALPLRQASVELLIVANFCEVFLAKEGHAGPVGVNYLEKIQLPTLPSLFGAILAGVDYVLMGGGIPLAIPGVLDRLAAWGACDLALRVEDNPEQRDYVQQFDPRSLCPGEPPPLTRPTFLAIISSDVVGKTMLRRANGAVDGFVVETHTAGGHNAPPRKADRAQPQFGPRDVPDTAAIRDLGRPFWLGGGYASPARLMQARDLGAAGVQVGTAFAYCRESGMATDLKRQVLAAAQRGEVDVVTAFRASPTGYPFKIVQTAAIPGLHPGAARERVCDLGYLRMPYIRADGALGYRCPAEPVESYLKKGGALEDTVGRRCLCNGLLATIGLGQRRASGVEPPLVTSGEDFSFVAPLIRRCGADYSARDVIGYLRDEDSSSLDGAR